VGRKGNFRKGVRTTEKTTGRKEVLTDKENAQNEKKETLKDHQR